MTDRELLEMAAKAAGIRLDKSPYNGGGSENTGFDVMGNAVLDWHNNKTWNPLTDDGDALRLAVKLNIGVMSAQYTGRTCAWLYCKSKDGEFFEPHGKDIAAATRRAIVRAAAEIGKDMS